MLKEVDDTAIGEWIITTLQTRYGIRKEKILNYYLAGDMLVIKYDNIYIKISIGLTL